MNWDDYYKKGIIRKTIIDRGLIKSLILSSENKLDFLENQDINDKNSSIILANYYECLREICEAVSILNELKIYQHEAITLFLKDKLKETNIAEIFDRYRRIRNKINYYGKQINKQETLKAKIEIKETIKKLKEKYLSEFK